MMRTKMLSCGVLLAVVAVLVLTSGASDPGVKVRVTMNGIKYASSVAHSYFAESVKETDLEPVTDRWHGLRYQFWDTKIKIPNLSPLTLKLDPKNKRLSLSIFAQKVEIYSQFKFIGIFKGTMDGYVNDAGATVSVSLDIGPDGRPLLIAVSCQGTFRSIHVYKRHLSHKVYDKLVNVATRAFKRTLQSKLCQVLLKGVNDDAHKYMSKLKVATEVLDKSFQIDYRLSSVPVITAEYLDVSFKGGIHWNTDMSPGPHSPNPIPAMSDTSRMLYMWLTEYPVHTFLYAAQNHGYLNVNISRENLPDNIGGYLDTSCWVLCVGRVIPQIGFMYPKRYVKMIVSSNSVPNFKISPSGIHADLSTNIGLYAEAPGKETVYLLTLSMSLSLSVKVKMVSERLVGEISDYSFKLGVVDSDVGPVFETVLDAIMRGILYYYGVPHLNDLAKNGVDLPLTTGDLRFKNIHFELLEGLVLIATDIHYDPVTQAKSTGASLQSVLWTLFSLCTTTQILYLFKLF